MLESDLTIERKNSSIKTCKEKNSEVEEKKTKSRLLSV